jgi:glycosyltransferase involved in cell wall biosynthesis
MTRPCTALASPLEFLRRATVVIPARNEAPCVAEAVSHWLERGVASARVIDNGSTDDTAARALAAGATVIYESRRGYGAAAWRGTCDLPPEAEWIVFSSADGSDRLNDAAAAEFQGAIAAGADLVLGERVSQPESRRHLGGVQQWGNAFCCGLIALGWGRSFRDMASLRAIRHAAFAKLNLRDRGFGWNVEMQVRALEENLSIAEVPVTYFPRIAGQPKISGHPLGIVRAARGILFAISRLYFSRGHRIRGKVALADTMPGGPGYPRI